MSGTWESFDMGGPRRIPSRPGVYVAQINGMTIYVGQSIDLRARIATYRIRNGFDGEIITPWGKFPRTDSVVIKFKVSRRMGDWAMWEIRLIHKLKPKFNSTFAKMNRAA